MMLSSTLIVGLPFGLIFYFLWRLWQERRKYKTLPGPPHHPLFGHIPIMAQVARSLPPDANPQCYAHHIRQRYSLGSFFYLDLWPLSQPQLVIVNHELAAQLTQHTQPALNKGSMIRKFLGPLVGTKAMVAANGHEWKLARRLFAPSMLHGNLLPHVPDMVYDSRVFHSALEQHAKTRDVFAMEDLTAKLIFNIAVRVILGIDCDALRAEHRFMTLFRNQASLLPTAFWARYLIDPNPVNAFLRWRNRRDLDSFIGKIVDDRFKARSAGSSGEEAPLKRQKMIAIDYALEVYGELQQKGDNSHLTAESRDMIITQVKTLIFAGHDSSSSTICYVYNLLSKHPEALAKIRREHDSVFGSDIGATWTSLEQNPALVNKLPYTLAVIKEALRLWPPIGGSYREGRKDVNLVIDGQTWPTYPWATFVNDHAIMRNEKIFRDPERFLPERYLVTDPADPYFVHKDAWRAFEKGPRNCIGEAMALIQLKVVMVVTLRSFDICEMYADDDPVVDDKKMYQTLDVTAKPSRGMPVKVKLSDSEW